MKIVSQDNLKYFWTKLKSKLSTVSFTGNYSDLNNKPTSMPANGGNADTLDGKHANDFALKNSPTFTGTPLAPTATVGTATTQIATTQFVQNAVSSSGGGDMLKANYATASNTIVDESFNSQKLGGYTADTFIVSTDAGSVVNPNPINADQLGGHPYSDFLLSTNTDVLKKNDVTDNLTTPSTSLPLSANQGKVIADKITTVEESITEKAPINSPTFTGVAKVASNTNYVVPQLRNIVFSTIEPTANDGENGDIWIMYSE